MSAQIFPDVQQIMELLLAELPNGVYATDLADDPNSDRRSFTSSELRAHAQLLANLYSNLNDINSDKAITTVTPEGLAPWELELFAAAQDASLSYMTRQQNLLAKIRANGGISLPAIDTIVHGVLDPVGLPFVILPYSGQTNGSYTGAWVLDYSPLDEGTYLTLLDPIIGAQTDFVPLDCSLDYAAAGITAQELADIQATAYTYEVRIFGVADQATLNLLDRQLTALEPARSTHVITNNAPEPVDPNVIDFGAPGSNTLVDIIDFNGPIDITYDIWDFGSTS